MLDLQSVALEAVRSRRGDSWRLGEILDELKAAGCSDERVDELLVWAAINEPHEHAGRVFRMMKRAAKAAADGDAGRFERLYAAAVELAGSVEVDAIVKYHQLKLQLQPHLVDARTDVVSEGTGFKPGFVTV